MDTISIDRAASEARIGRDIETLSGSDYQQADAGALVLGARRGGRL